MELDGYKGTYIGFITTNDYEKKNVKQRYIVNLEFDGFFVDDDLSITFDGKTSASFYKVGTRDAPCVVEVYAKSALTNYTITGLGEDDIIIESLAAGKTVKLFHQWMEVAVIIISVLKVFAIRCMDKILAFRIIFKPSLVER